MLRTVPDVGKIFLLIKAKDKDAAMDRMKSEIIDSELFKCLEQIHGKSYKAFMLNKLVPIVGNVCESNLGMDADSASEIAKEVDVIVNSAANTVFDERYDIALDTNTRGPSRLLGFAKKCKKLSLFLHVSTAYANGERQGIILEKPFCMGESIARERIISESPPISLPVLDIDAEIKLALDLRENAAATQKMKELGLERARLHGWQNTYVFTKAMGEMLISSMRGDIPVVIIRPSIIESTCRDPFPGWIQGNRMLDPLILSYGKGQLPGFLADPKTVTDVVPADMVVNATMAAMAKHGIAGQPGLSVYQVASSLVNPLVFNDVINFSRDYFTASPFMDSKGKRITIMGMKFFSSINDFSSYIWDEIGQQSGLMDADISDPMLSRRLEMKRKKKVDYVTHFAKMYEPYAFYGGWFDNSNTQKLMEEMSGEEMTNFGFDVGSIDWEDYISNVHIPGLMRHVMKGRLVAG
ncbi:hypothetical protein L1049_014616 [Liquidambar formosana]|uniref:Fatty acyl-CoA reductase n=1 Tax=Liquidambar formosana TaxID=63359 RepID=A0AAP0RW56_LIQFO